MSLKTVYCFVWFPSDLSSPEPIQGKLMALSHSIFFHCTQHHGTDVLDNHIFRILTPGGAS
jgi:hypothetical protein